MSPVKVMNLYRGTSKVVPRYLMGFASSKTVLVAGSAHTDRHHKPQTLNTVAGVVKYFLGK